MKGRAAQAAGRNADAGTAAEPTTRAQGMLAEDQALAHLQQAVAQDANYSVAWKQLGKVQLALDDAAGARDAWNKGLACAEAKGDAQVVKELQVFLKRLDKQQAAS